MVAYWQSIGFSPETEEMNEVDVDNAEILQQENIHKDDSTKSKPKMNKEMIDKYSGVVIKGFHKDINVGEVVKSLKKSGLPKDYDKEDIQFRKIKASLPSSGGFRSESSR